MTNNLRFLISDNRPKYQGGSDKFSFDDNRTTEFNHRHNDVLTGYDLELQSCSIVTLCNKINNQSNLGALRNRKVRQSVILSAALSAIAVGLHGRGSLNEVPEENITKELTNRLKRANDRTAAQIMAEVLQFTTEALPLGEEVLIESAITEGARAKPGKEPGGNPTIAVGAVFGKKEHQAQYGMAMPPSISLLSMGSDVVEGTTKSVKGQHSSMTTLFVTESNIKRHLPDIYIQRWMSGSYFEEFNPRETNLTDAAEIIAQSYGHSGIDKLGAFFLDRPRHYPAMDILNKAGVATPMDIDGDMIPGVMLGLDDITFSDGQVLNSMIGEIGGSAEWVIGVLPLVWRGGQAIGMLTSHSSLTRNNLTSEEKWNERFHFTEEEFMMIQDARFERKPYFTMKDIIEDPFAGGISAFGAITDNYYVPFMRGVERHPEDNTISVNVLTVTSLGIMECWQMVFRAKQSIDKTISKMTSPKEQLVGKSETELDQIIGRMLADPVMRKRYRIFFNNEYYPALIPVRDKMVVLHKAVQGLIERKALAKGNEKIVAATEKLAPEWFINSD